MKTLKMLCLALSLLLAVTSYAADEGGDGPKMLKFDFEGVDAARKEIIKVQTLSNNKRVHEIVEFLKKNSSFESVEAMMSALLNLVETLNESNRKKINSEELISIRHLRDGIEATLDEPNINIYKQVMALFYPYLPEEDVQNFIENEDALEKRLKRNPKLKHLKELRQNPFILPQMTEAERSKLLPSLVAAQDPNQINLNKDKKNTLLVNSNTPTKTPTPIAAAETKPEEETLLVNIHAKKKDLLRKTISKEVVGQPELVDALAELNARSSLMSGRLKGSPVLYLLGTSQSGKATAVQSYVRAMFPKAKDPLKHLFEINTPVRDQASFWKLTGTSSGLVGGNDPAPLLRFLVMHSGGRYRLHEPKEHGETFKVLEDPQWSPGFISAKDFQPEHGVIYIKNFDDWSKEYKDEFVKTFLKDGTFELQQSAGGVFKIHVPVTIILSSKEGQMILSTRDINGQRRGYAYTQEQVQERWEKAHKDDELLMNTLRSSNYKTATATTGGASNPGISEDLLSLLKSKIVLLRPLQNNHLENLTQLKIDQLNEKLKNARIKVKIKLELDPASITALSQYKLDPEASSASIALNVKNLIEEPLLGFLTETQDLFSHSNELPVQTTLIENPDGTKSLKLAITAADYKGAKKEFILPINSTRTDSHPTKLSKERIQYWQNVSLKIQQNVFGISKELADRIANSFMLAEDRGLSNTPDEQKREGALIVALLGLSSTGKSELTAILSEATLGHRAARFVIDFNQVKTIEDVKAKILGIRDGNGQCKPSEFLEMYTRSNGNFMVVFEEMANAPKELLKAAYDILREPIVTTFCDGKPRSMKQVKILITGNVGEEVFKSIPAHFSDSLRAMMWTQLYQYFMNNKVAQRQILEAYFSKALINRMGADNITFMAPLSFQSRWELIQKKIIDSLKGLKGDKGRYGWNVQFDTEQDLQNFMEMIDEEGFVLEEQGASIDRVVKNILDRDLRATLMQNQITHPKMADGNTILLKFDKKKMVLDRDQEGDQKSFEIQILSQDRSESTTLAIKGRRNSRIPPQNHDDVLKTAIHEIGHLVSTLYLAKERRPTYVSILPGIGADLTMHLGVAYSEDNTKTTPTRDEVLEHLARMMGGYVAEQTFFGHHTMGVSDDFKRATTLAQKAILTTGFSKKWGLNAIPEGMTLNEYIHSLSDQDRKTLDDEVRALLKEAEGQSQKALNQAIEYGTFQKFTSELAKKGYLNEKDIKEIADQKVESKKSLFSLPSWLKGNSNKDILSELKKGEVVTVESLVEKEISSQRSKALKLEVPIANKSSCASFLR